MGNNKILLEFSEFPYWAGLQKEPGIRETPPYSLGWNKHGFIYQSTPKEIINQVVEAYSADDYSFITKPPGNSKWSNQLGDAMVKFGSQVLGDIQKATVLEIGAGSDYVASNLSSIKDISNYTIVDPAIDSEAKKQSSTNLISGYFGECDLGRKTFDVVFSFNCLEHVPEPIKFLWNVRNLMRDDKARLGFMFPNIERQIIVGDFNGIVHEHMNYFTPSTARRAFELCGFSILSSWSTGDSFYVIAKPENQIFRDYEDIAAAPDEILDQSALKIETSFMESQKRAQRLIYQAISAGENVAFHGATNGLNSLLYVLGLSGNDTFQIFDSDDTKSGLYLPAISNPVRHSSDPSYRSIKKVFVAATSFFEPIRELLLNNVGLEDSAIIPLFPLEP